MQMEQQQLQLTGTKLQLAPNAADMYCKPPTTEIQSDNASPKLCQVTVEMVGPFRLHMRCK